MSSDRDAAYDVFFSYSHRDGDLRDELEAHLARLKREGAIHTWHDRRIGAGREWEGEIDEHLESAHLVLLLISSDFLTSDYCFDVEMKRALDRHDAGQARVIPILLRPEPHAIEEDPAPSANKRSRLRVLVFVLLAATGYWTSTRVDFNKPVDTGQVMPPVAEEGDGLPEPPPLPSSCERARKKTGIDFVYVPEGWYTLGPNPGHRVFLNAFWVGKTEVSNQQFARFLKEDPAYQQPTDARFNQGNQPVVSISWLDHNA